MSSNEHTLSNFNDAISQNVTFRVIYGKTGILARQIATKVALTYREKRIHNFYAAKGRNHTASYRN